VDPEPKLGVTKVWINVLLRDGGKVLGVIGTGLDLSGFIHNVADISQPGITNLFLDRDGAIQIYRDTQYIDYSSITKSADKRRSVDLLLDEPADGAWVRRAIAQVEAGHQTVATGLVRIKGKSYLAGVAALPEVGWFDMTLLDLDVLLPRRDFLDVALAMGAGVLLLLLVLAFTVHRLVLRPVAKLTSAAEHVARGDFVRAEVEHGAGEVGRLASQFSSMTDSIQRTQNSLEEAVARQTRDLMDAKRMLEISLAEERVGRRAQANLLALMAHEVRSPIAVIGNTAQMLNALAVQEKPEWVPRIEKIMAAVRQLAQLMDEVLDENRIGLQSRGLERQRGDLNAFCDELRVSRVASGGRDICFEPSVEDAALYADWQLIKIAVSNLIDNAEKYSPPAGEVTLRVRRAGARAMAIEVHDHGTPIPPELAAQVFEKFTRGQQDDSVPGVGLGLYLVDWIVRLHGGRAEVVAEEDGNTFRLVLPQR
jgi:signal transduction histidine kinase